MFFEIFDIEMNFFVPFFFVSTNRPERIATSHDRNELMDIPLGAWFLLPMHQVGAQNDSLISNTGRV